MPCGYVGSILEVDLTTGEISTKPLADDICRKYLGGIGVATRLLWENTMSETSAFSPENWLVFMTGPVAATAVPGSSRYVVAGISPLTNILGQANGGGAFAYRLKTAGYDGIIVKGKANEPVYLQVHSGGAEIRTARHLWGKDTWETNDLVVNETSKMASVIAIGPAGEKLVRYACIVGEGRAGRTAARCGMGAVMGWKGLKAIAVDGGAERPEMYDLQGLRENLRQKFVFKHLDEIALVKEWTSIVAKIWDEGRAPVKNYQTGHFEGEEEFREKWVAQKAVSHPLHCKSCPVSCIESALEGTRRHQTRQSILCLGTRCLVDDMDTLQEAYDLCNRFGIEVMSLGGVLAYVMELYEKGLITAADTGGLELRYGDAKLLLDLINIVASREGFGHLLGEGVVRIAQRIGGLAQEYAMHVKGHELPLYDVRSWNAAALEYATASTGAHHYEGQTLAATLVSRDFFGSAATDRFATDGVGSLTAWAQNFGNVLDSMVVCKMMVGATRTGQRLPPEQFVEWINFVTRMDLSLDSALRIGERIFNLKRLFNVRRGISRKDDTLPLRLLCEERGSGEGGTATNLPPLGRLLNEYYAVRGWSAVGIPTREKLAELGLSQDAVDPFAGPMVEGAKSLLSV